mmetsp:Transcript_39481/g.86212  ORF Transcript_39481/g.86212 Transcript_39481/m.86212 type:complete len:240 (-) Transcript_39481:4114-4833(-)
MWSCPPVLGVIWSLVAKAALKASLNSDVRLPPREEENGIMCFSMVDRLPAMVPMNMPVLSLRGGSSSSTWRICATTRASSTKRAGRMSCEAQAFLSRRADLERLQRRARNCCRSRAAPSNESSTSGEASATAANLAGSTSSLLGSACPRPLPEAPDMQCGDQGPSSAFSDSASILTSSGPMGDFCLEVEGSLCPSVCSRVWLPLPVDTSEATSMGAATAFASVTTEPWTTALASFLTRP